MNTIKKMINFVVDHPIISMIITGLIITFVEGYSTREWNFAGCFFVAIFIFALLAPFIRKAREKKERKEEIDYLVNKLKEK